MMFVFYHLLCSLLCAGFQRLLVNRLTKTSHRSVLAAFQPQAELLDQRQVRLAGGFILFSWSGTRQRDRFQKFRSVKICSLV